MPNTIITDEIVMRKSLSPKFRSTKKQKNLKVGTLFKMALDEIHGQTLQIFLFLTFPERRHLVLTPSTRGGGGG